MKITRALVTVLLPFLIVALAVVAWILASEWSISQLQRTAQRFEAAVVVNSLVSQWRTTVVDAETAQRGYLLMRKAEYLLPFEQAEKLRPEIVVQLRLKTLGDSELTQLVVAAQAAVVAKMNELRSTVWLARNQRYAEAMQIVNAGQGGVLMLQVRKQFDRLENETQQRLAAAQAARQRNMQLMRFFTFAISALLFVLLVILLRYVLKDRERQEIQQAEVQNTARMLEEQVNSRTAELANLSTHLQKVAETERADLARELHDELGSLLTAAKMDLSWLIGRFKVHSDESARDMFTNLGKALDQAMSVKRRVVENLRPSLLDHFGLTVALKSYFDETCQKAGINCATQLPEKMSDMPAAVQLTLFRVAQEALTNAIRHSKARNLRLEISSAAEGIIMLIKDDGQGFDLKNTDLRRSHGISGMRHRVLNLKGTFNFDSSPGKGTHYRIFVPHGGESPEQR
jgi:signal transduction histidine kinase